MSKELSPLKALKILNGYACNNLEYLEYSDDLYPIIEKELKEYEVLKEYHNAVVSNREFDKEYFYKCIKALEIIKEKTLTINDLYWLKNGNYQEYRKNLEMLYSGAEEEHLQKILKTQEEYDLLKEVLL